MRPLPLLALSILLIFSTRAEAKKPAIIGWGEKIAEVSELPPAKNIPGVKVGLYYNSFRVFFIPVVSWDKKLVLYSEAENRYDDLSETEVAELEKSLGSLATKGGMGANWARWCNWVWVVLIGLFIGKKLIGGSNRGPIQPRE